MNKKIIITILLITIFFLISCGGTSDMNNDNGNKDNISNTEYDYWEDSNTFGLTVNNDGTLSLGKKNFRAIGVNYYSLFCSTLPDMPSQKNYKLNNAYSGLQKLADNGVTIVRFNCGVYYPADYDYYFNNKELYLESIKKIAQKAEELRIGLIPSLFWQMNSAPDYYDEPLGYWGKTETKTDKYMLEYTRDIVEALKNYKSIFGWEFGNEFNLGADLPNWQENRPPLPSNSKRESRTIEDLPTTEGLNSAFKRFAELVNSLDSNNRLITSGNAVNRSSQYNQWQSMTWVVDNQEEHNTVLSYLNPSPMNCISEHNYFENYTLKNGNLTFYEYLDNSVKYCHSEGKAYLVGEYGASGDFDGTEFEEYESMTRDITATNVDIALLWNYDPKGGTEFSFTSESEKGIYLFELLRNYNNIINY